MTATWTQPLRPGDAVRRKHLRKGDDVGTIHIEDYAGKWRISAYLPGIETVEAGKVLRVDPDFYTWKYTVETANAEFDHFVEHAMNTIGGWEEI